MIQLPLFPCNCQDHISVLRVQSDLFEYACNQVYAAVVGKPNEQLQRTSSPPLPVIAAGVEAGYWQLYSNDPELSVETLQACGARLRRLQYLYPFQRAFREEFAAPSESSGVPYLSAAVTKLRVALSELAKYLRWREANTKDLTLKVEFAERAQDAEQALEESQAAYNLGRPQLQRIIRQRPLTAEEAAEYNKIREQVAQDLPELITRHHDCMAKQAAGECWLPPLGWRCTRAPGHTGPCAAVPDTRTSPT